MGWFERAEFGANVGLIDEIYRQYLDNPESVSPAWRDFFAENEPEGYEDPSAQHPPAPAEGPAAHRGPQAPQGRAGPPPQARPPAGRQDRTQPGPPAGGGGPDR